MWLNGFNDNLPGFPRSPCKHIACSAPYMGPDQPGTPVDPGAALQGPYGTGISGPSFGLCPVDRDWMTERYNSQETGSNWVVSPPEAPRGRDGTDEVMSLLALKKISAFSGIGHGFYFWNFRTDLYNPQWSYLLALERGWIPRGDLNDDRIINSCHREDLGEFVCEARRDAPADAVKNGIKYALGEEKKDADYIDDLQGEPLYVEADEIFDEFWKSHRAIGATCDFGGTAMLSEENITHTDDYYSDDYYNIEVKGLDTWKIVALVVIGTLVGSLTGFALAMKLSPRFSRRVRSSVMLRPVTHSAVFRRSFGNLLEPGLQGYTGLSMD